MAGWARRSESVSSNTSVSAWAGNLVVQKIVQKDNKELALAPVDNVAADFSKPQKLDFEETDIAADNAHVR